MMEVVPVPAALAVEGEEKEEEESEVLSPKLSLAFSGLYSVTVTYCPKLT